MTKQEAIREACSIISLAYHSTGDYTEPSDGFCDKCPASRITGWNYQNSGKALAYVRAAVVAALKRDGIKLADSFNEDGTEKAEAR